MFHLPVKNWTARVERTVVRVSSCLSVVGAMPLRTLVWGSVLWGVILAPKMTPFAMQLIPQVTRRSGSSISVQVGVSSNTRCCVFDIPYRPSACQCNGHSRCVNGSVCELCMNATTGDNCQSCSIGFFGDAHNGGSCAGLYHSMSFVCLMSCDQYLMSCAQCLMSCGCIVCDCNGYDLECDVVSGSCQCQSLGVSGENCTVCVGDYNHGDADNFCYGESHVISPRIT